MENKIKQNAIKIAELKNEIPKKVSHTKWYRICEYLVADVTTNTAIYESYNGLMPIVRECNNSKININIFLYPNYLCIVNSYHKPIIHKFDNEPEFILAIQECIIKYLEVKNG